mgnify:CR=1 FL=1
MSAIANYFKSNGKNVAGYDRVPTKITTSLQQMGIEVHFEDAVSYIPKSCLNAESTLVVYTPAIPQGHLEFEYFKNNNFNVLVLKPL